MTPRSLALPKRVTTAAWPVLAGLVGLVLGLLMLGGAAFFYYQAQRLADSAVQVTPNRQLANVPPRESDSFISQTPPYSTHLDDISLLFKLAEERGVTIGPINYRSEASTTMPVVVRLLELRLDEEYPKLKGFVAELLRVMPHLYLEEIRVEQQGPSASKIQATLKLSLVYQGNMKVSPQSSGIEMPKQSSK